MDTQQEMEHGKDANKERSNVDGSLRKDSHGTMRIRLNFDYDKWMKNKDKYDLNFRQEISAALGVDIKTIGLGDHERGSTDIGTYVYNVWAWYKKYIEHNLDETSVNRRFYESIDVQDQIKVKVKNKWHRATVTKYIYNGYSKYFQVRYNPKNNNKGKNPFWRNTEWFYTDNEDGRLMYEDKEAGKYRNEQGEDVPIFWKPPSLAKRNDREDIRVNDHIFVKYDAPRENSWFRSKVYAREVTDQGAIWINVKNLVSGKTIKLDLTNDDDKDRISLVDMRSRRRVFEMRTIAMHTPM